MTDRFPNKFGANKRIVSLCRVKLNIKKIHNTNLKFFITAKNKSIDIVKIADINKKILFLSKINKFCDYFDTKTGFITKVRFIEDMLH